MKRFIYSLFIVSICYGLPSCTKFLDEQPRHSLVGESAISNLETAKAALGGVYATFQNNEWSGALYISYASKSGFARYQASDYTMTYTQAAPSAYVSGMWNKFYISLNAANFALEGISALSTEATKGEAAKKALIAEARILRAWINANILWTFGHWWADDSDIYGLLYRDEQVSLKNVLQARITVGESYKRIHEDLDFAIQHADDFTSSRSVSKQFAKALKAKLLLYRGGYRNTTDDLREALVLVNDVLNNHPASFAMEADMNDLYKNSWDSKENLFARYLENNGNRKNTGGYHYTTYLSQIAGDRLPLATGAQTTARLIYGLNWFKADPRWEIATGPVRSAAIYDESMFYTFKKLARLGQYAGSLSTDPNAEKYAAYYFRYPELYIMKSELLARTGASISESIAPINEMRSKRTVPVLNALIPSSHEELMDMIFKEIFIETFLENGSEFFAAVRFQHLGQPWVVTIKNGLVFNENKMCWPIPEPEMTNNTLLEQNPE